MYVANCGDDRYFRLIVHMESANVDSTDPPSRGDFPVAGPGLDRLRRGQSHLFPAVKVLECKLVTGR
jgi:hypothetical protein